MDEEIFSLRDVVIKSAFPKWGYSSIDDVQCPLCNYTEHEMGSPVLVPGRDNYEAGWGGRGDLVVVPVISHCGHKWEICFGFHKGMIAAFVRIN